jgi:hypothetical protein
MTATCNKTILQNMELFSGLKFIVANIFWPPLPGMRHQNVAFNLCYSSCPLALIQPRLKKFLLLTNETSNCIIFSNRHVKIEGIHLKLSLWLDSHNFHLVDTVSLLVTHAHS